MKRVVIYPKDIMIITGKSERYSRYLIQRIKNHLKKEDHQVVQALEAVEVAAVKMPVVNAEVKVNRKENAKIRVRFQEKEEGEIVNTSLIF